MIKRGRAGSVVAAALVACGLCLAGAATSSSAAGDYVPPGCPPVRYHSAPQLRAQRVCMNLGVVKHADQPATYLFLTPGGDAGLGAGIYHDDGTLMWWLRPGTARVHNLTVVRYQGRSYLALWAGRPVDRGQHEAGAVWLYNEHYQRVGTIHPGGRFRSDGVDLHEFRVTAQGDALIATTPRVRISVDGHRREVFDFVVQEVSLVHDSTGIHTGRVLFQWRALKQVPLSQSHVRPPSHGTWNYFHGNSIAQDSDGNLIVSSRNTWGIYKINVKTGQTMWQLGTKGHPQLGQRWCYQHDVTPLGHDRYSLFDDGGSDPGCSRSAHTAHPARGLIIQVAPSTRPAGARLIRAYTHSPAIYPAICGGMQRLGDGDWLIDWGNVPEVTEYRPDGSTSLDLTMSQWSYRAYRFAWVGLPLTPPAVAARQAAPGVRLWASWNGSTLVAAWRVLAGTSPSHLIPVTGPRPKTGFETEISISGRHPWVAVQALSANGSVLATSKPISTGS